MFKKIRKFLLMFVVVFALICGVAFAACEPGGDDEHKCGDVCTECGKCLTDCEEPECADKCEGHGSVNPNPNPGPDDDEDHECEDVCTECGGCLTECEEPECANKCEGHEPSGGEDEEPEELENVAFILGELENIDELVSLYGSAGAEENVELYNDGNTVITGMTKMKINESSWNYHTGATVSSNGNSYEIPGLEEAEDITFTHRLQTGGKVTTSGGVIISGAVKIEVADAAHITVYARSGSSNGVAADRQFGFYEENGTLLHQFELPESTEGLIYTYDTDAAGTVYAGGTNGFNIQYIKVEYNYEPPVDPNPGTDPEPGTDPVEPEEPMSYDLSATEPTENAVIGGSLAMATTFNLSNVEAGEYTLTVQAGPSAGMAEVYVVVGSETVTLTNNYDGSHSGKITIAAEESIKVYTNGATLEEVTVTLAAYVAGGEDEEPAAQMVVYKVQEESGAASGENHVNTDGGVLTENALMTMTATQRTQYNSVSNLTFNLTEESNFAPTLGSRTRSGKTSGDLFAITAKADVTVVLYVQLSDSGYAANRTGNFYVTGNNTQTVANGGARANIVKIEIPLEAGQTASVSYDATANAYAWIFAVESIPGISEVEPEPVELVLNIDEPATVTIPDSGEVKYTLNIPETGNYTLTIDGDAITAYYTYDEAIEIENFEVDPGVEIVFKGAAGATAQVTIAKYVAPVEPEPAGNVLTVSNPVTVTFTKPVPSENGVTATVDLEVTPGKYTLTLTNISESGLWISPSVILNVSGDVASISGMPLADGASATFEVKEGDNKLTLQGLGDGTIFSVTLNIEEYIAAAGEVSFSNFRVGYTDAPTELTGLVAGTYNVTIAHDMCMDFGASFVFYSNANGNTVIGTVDIEWFASESTGTVTIPDGVTVYIGSGAFGNQTVSSITFTPVG